MKSFAPRFFRTIIAAILAMSLMPLAAYAEDPDPADANVPSTETERENTESDSSGVIRPLNLRIDSVDNPLTGGTGEVTTQILPAEGPPSLDADPAVYITQDEAVAQLKEGMANRQTTIAVSLKTNSNYASLNGPMFYAAMEEDGDPTHGDYLRWIWTSMRCNMTGYIESATGLYHITYTYSIEYKTNSSNEASLMTAVDSALSGMNLSGKSKYEKAVAIYDYICDNVSYDYTSYDSAQKLQYTAYAAMINKKCVCQGYACLFYLMAGKAGLSTRVIAGTGGGGSHAWNIVQLDDGKYYNLDATWDSQRAQAGQAYAYFLKSNADFPDHTRNSTASGSNLNYTSSAFNAAYPMASASWSGIPIVASNVTLSQTSYDYNATVRTPSVTVVKNGVTLKEDKDYTVTYESGRKRSGEYTVTVKGIGSYGGTVKKTFVINDVELTEDMVSLSYSLANYNGDSKVPTATVRVNGVSQYTSEYTVTYWNSEKSAQVTAKNVGTYWVKVTAKDDANTTGYVWKKLTVRPKATDFTSVTALNNGFKAVWTKRTVQCSGYQVSYEMVGGANTFTKTVSGYANNSTSVTVLKDKKTYQIKVRTYKTVDDTKYYSVWSDARSVTTT